MGCRKMRISKLTSSTQRRAKGFGKKGLGSK
jgi:hypothetical protein